MRQLESNKANTEEFDLSEFLMFKVELGDEDSASAKSLTFHVRSTTIENDLVSFKIDFENPDSVSIGSKQDKLIVEIANPNFFSSKDSG